MTTQSLTRTSAVIYADNISSRKTETIKKKFIEAVFTANDNKSLTIEEIAASLLLEMGLSFTDEEIEAIVKDQETFVLLQVDTNMAHDKYNLVAKRYHHLTEKSEENIDAYITQYFREREINDSEAESLKGLLENYLYSMINSNIEAFNQVLGGKAINSCNQNGRVNPEDFSDEQILKINDFLSWKNPSKDKELFKLVSCCIEYAIVANNTNERTLHQSLRNKVLYIDNAFIYRAIGINGENRKRRTCSFLQKCNESGQTLRISKYSRDEFFRTIDYNIRQLNNTTPFGRINPDLFQKYCYGETIYQFYHNWRSNRYTYGFNSFKTYVVSEYDNLIKSYGIEEDFRPPFDEKEDIPEIERYANEIATIKRRGHKYSHDTDARNMYWIEKARNGVDGKLIDTKYYFVTPDQKLQLWDSGHSLNQPITLLPSQWLALLLKFTSRSADDYKSFVSFLRLPHNETELNPEELQEILAGISEVTEDLQKQENFLASYMEEEWRQMQNTGALTALRENARRFTKDKQEQLFREELERRSQEMAKSLDKEKQLNKKQLEALEAGYKQQLLEQDQQNQKNQLSISCDYLERALNAAQRQLVDATKRKNLADAKMRIAMNRVKFLFVMVLLIIAAAWIYLIFRVGWEKMEVFTYVLGAVVFVGTALYLILFEKELSLRRTMELLRQKKQLNIYNMYNVSTSIIEECLNEVNALQEELAEEKSKLSAYR